MGSVCVCGVLGDMNVLWTAVMPIAPPLITEGACKVIARHRPSVRVSLYVYHDN